MAEHKIVLVVPQGSEAGVAEALSQVFSLPQEVTREIANGAPIVILDGLDPEQAKRVMAEMASVKQAGGNLAISAAAGGSLGAVNWPSPPTISGRALETYLSDYVPPAPGPEPVSPAEAAAMVAAEAPAALPVSAPQAAAPPAAPPGAGIVCPHCGKAVYVQLSAAPPGAAGAPARGAGSGQIAQPLGSLPEVPDVPGQVAPQRPPSGTAARAGPMDLEEFEKSVGGGQPQAQPTGDDLLRQLDASLEAEPQDPGLKALEAGAPVAPPPQPPPQTPPQRPPQPPRRKAARPGSQRARTPGRRRDRRR